VNRQDRILQAARMSMAADDRLWLDRQLDTIERRIREVAAMAPGTRFADMELRAVAMIASSVYEKTRAVQWFDDVCAELRAHAARLEGRS
jgi:hypothetical protein